MKSYYAYTMAYIGTHQHSFERYHPRPPYGLPFPKIEGSQPQLKTAIAIISGTGKATTANLADTFTGSIRAKPMKNLKEKRERFQSYY